MLDQSNHCLPLCAKLDSFGLRILSGELPRFILRSLCGLSGPLIRTATLLSFRLLFLTHGTTYMPHQFDGGHERPGNEPAASSFRLASFPRARPFPGPLEERVT